MNHGFIMFLLTLIGIYVYFFPARLVWKMKEELNVIVRVIGTLMCLFSPLLVFAILVVIDPLLPKLPAPATTTELRMRVGDATSLFYGLSFLVGWLVYFVLKLYSASNKSLKDAP